MPCTGGYQFGNRYFRCWDKRGHGSLDLAGRDRASRATSTSTSSASSSGSRKLIAGGVELGIATDGHRSARGDAAALSRRASTTTTRSTGRGLEQRRRCSTWRSARARTRRPSSTWRASTARSRRDGTRREAGDRAARPERERDLQAHAEQMDRLRAALAGVSSRAARRPALGDQGRAARRQDGHGAEGTPTPARADHAWFVGFAPADDPKIVVAVMLEFGVHGSRAARIASAIIGALPQGRRRSSS